VAKRSEIIELLSTYSLRYLNIIAEPNELFESTMNARMFMMNERRLMGVKANRYKLSVVQVEP
jgi:hypothetical protein